MPKRTIAFRVGCWLIAGVTVVGVAAVALFGPLQDLARERMVASTIPRKAASVEELRNLDPKTEELLRIVTDKTEMVFSDCKGIVIEEIPGGGLSMVPAEDAGTCRLAAVVPVAADGYFLTAAHAVEGSSSQVVAILTDGDRMSALAAPARVVWIPSDWRVRPDLALLHADVGSVEPFEVAETPPSKEDTVLLTGSGGGRATSVGRVLAVGPVIAGQRGSIYRLVRHNAPSMRGDSGGALASLKGTLIGIGSTIHPPDWLGWLPYIGSRISNLMGGVGSYSQAVCPDPDWLDDLIAADRQRRMEDWLVEDPVDDGGTSRLP